MRCMYTRTCSLILTSSLNILVGRQWDCFHRNLEERRGEERRGKKGEELSAGQQKRFQCNACAMRHADCPLPCGAPLLSFSVYNNGRTTGCAMPDASTWVQDAGSRSQLASQAGCLDARYPFATKERKVGAQSCLAWFALVKSSG